MLKQYFENLIKIVGIDLIIMFFFQYLVCGESILIKLRKKHSLFLNVVSVMFLHLFFNIFLFNAYLSSLFIIPIYYVLSLFCYYIHEFRGTNLNFSDILSINTAKEVASSYTYPIKFRFFIVLILYICYYYYIINYIDLQFYKYLHWTINGVRTEQLDIYILVFYIALNISTFCLFYFILKDEICRRKYDYSLNAGINEGYLYNFFSSIFFFHITDDSEKEHIDIEKKFIVAVKKQKKIAINKSKFADIIVVMNESFGSVHNRIKTNIPVTPYYDSLKGVIKGDVLVNTFGGGTANTEFEFLTGFSIGDNPYPVMPYNSYVKHDKYSIARYFKNLEYDTMALHPYTSTNYHRDSVYKYFGFDKLVFYNDFNNKKYIRKFVSDESMYEEMIRRYEVHRINNQYKKGKEKNNIFMFGITMQNHSGYNSFPEQKIRVLDSEIRNKKQVESYLSLMYISDNALKTLVDYFKDVDEHVILSVFGDHNPSFGNTLNRILYDDDVSYEGTNAYRTPFFIYDNQRELNENVSEISANFLSLEILNAAGMPMDALHNTLNTMYRKVSYVNFHKQKFRSLDEPTYIDNKMYLELKEQYLRN